MPTTNPAKTIFGAAYDVEFGNIAAAIATKTDATSAVTAINGTANQIVASAATGSVVLTLPSAIILPGTLNAALGSLQIAGVAQVSDFAVVKPTTQSVTSNTTQANDSALSFALISGATYIIEVGIQANGTGGGLAYNLNYSGTFAGSGGTTGPSLYSSSYTITNTAVSPNSSPLQIQTTVTGLSQAVTASNMGSVITQIGLRGTITTTSAGILGFAWAQQASSATATTVNAGSYLRITRLA